jgi:hypothetical protein
MARVARALTDVHALDVETAVRCTTLGASTARFLGTGSSHTDNVS